MFTKRNTYPAENSSSKKLLSFFALPSWFLVIFGFISLFCFSGNKFDTANSIYLVAGCLILSVFLTLYGFTKNLTARIRTKASQKKSFGKTERREPPWTSSRSAGENSTRSFLIPKLVKDFFFPKFIAIIFALWVTLSFFTSQTANVGYAEVIMTWAGVLFFISPNVWWNKKVLGIGGLTLLVTSSLLGIELYVDSPHQRFFGLFFNPAVHTDAWPNAFAVFVLMLWPLFLLWQPQKKLFKLIRLLSISVAIAALLASFSRAGISVFFVQLLVVTIITLLVLKPNETQQHEKTAKFKEFIKEIGKKFGYAIIIAILSLTIAAGTLLVRNAYFHQTTPLATDKIKFAKGEEVTSVLERVHFWQKSLELMQREPLLGFGPMSFSYIYRSVQPDWLEVSDHPHNIFFKLGVESGIPAAILMALFILSLFIATVLRWKTFDDKTKYELMILWVALGGGLLHHQVDYNFNFVTNALIFWLLFKAILVETSCMPSIRTTSGEQTMGFNSGEIEVGMSRIIGFNEILLLTALLCSLWFFGLAVYPSIVGRVTGIPFPLEEKTFFQRYALLEEGDRARDRGDLEKADLYYRLHIKKNPIDATGYTRLGEMARANKDYREALTYFEKALSRDQKNYWIHYRNYVETLNALQDYSTLLAFEPELIKEIELYLPKIKGNLHYAAQKNDPHDLLSVLKIMEEVDKARSEKYKEYEKVVNDSIQKYKSP